MGDDILMSEIKHNLLVIEVNVIEDSYINGTCMDGYEQPIKNCILFYFFFTLLCGLEIFNKIDEYNKWW